MMDHFYDKLLHLGAVFEQHPELIKNEWIANEAKERMRPLVDMALEFGRTGVVPEEKIKSWAANVVEKPEIKRVKKVVEKKV